MEFTENQIFAVFLFFIVGLAIYKCYEMTENFSNLENTEYMFYRPSTSCNQNKTDHSKVVKKSQEISENIIFSRPNKCFSCEKELLQKYAKQYVNLAFPGKCFSCEAEGKKMGRNPYHEGPTKCFSCMNSGPKQ
tara:strand:+ start:68 stop:469 length:402 start_codon:yes stop_codon:yes gene_type:complete